MVVKMVHDHLVEMLGGGAEPSRGAIGIDGGLDLNAASPVGIMGGAPLPTAAWVSVV